MISDLIGKLTRVQALVGELKGLLADLSPDVTAEVVAELGVPAPRASSGKVAMPAIRSPDSLRTPLPAGSKAVSLAAVLVAAPLRVQDIAVRAGSSEAAVSQMLRANPTLFRKVEPDNRLSPWTLTESGRAVATNATPAPAT